MQLKRFTTSLIIIFTLLLSACAASPGAQDAMQEKPQSGEVMMEEGSQDAMAGEPHGEDNMAMEDKSDGGMAVDEKGEDAMSAESGAMEDKGSVSGGSNEGEMMDKSAEDAMQDESKDDQSMKDDSMSGGDAMGEDAIMEAPAWFYTELVNVRSGEGFRISDFNGKVVLVETMAVWCSNCLRQQQQVKALHDLLGERDDFVSLGLDIDPNEESEQLKNFTEQYGFDWVYAVSPADVSRELGQLYGAQYLNPPSTPMLIIDRHGEVHTLPFGIKSAEDLAKALQPFLDESM